MESIEGDTVGQLAGYTNYRTWIPWLSMDLVVTIGTVKVTPVVGKYRLGG